ncbi:MAG: MotE family protein [Rhizobiaceae bacterium]
MTASAADKPRKQVRVVGNKSLVSAPAGNFCTNIKDDAQERRYALKLQELNKLKAAVEARIVALENKRAELEAWQRKRDQFAELADTSLVEIYSKMRPDAAAGRLEMLEPTLAAAIVLKMPRRKASVVMNEMSAKVAASITQVIASSTAAKEPS